MQHIAEDMVNHPSHYADHCSIECIDAIELALGDDGTVNYCIGNVIKYLWRCKFKNGVEDLNKAEWYLNRLLEDDRYDYTTMVRYSDKLNYLNRLHEELLNEFIDKENNDEEINI